MITQNNKTLSLSRGVNYYTQDAYHERIWNRFFIRCNRIIAGKNPSSIKWTAKRMKMAIAYSKL